VVTIIHLADQANTIHRLLVTQMATKGVAGICRQGDEGAIADELRSLDQQTRLWRIRVNIDDACHVYRTKRQMGFKSSGNCGNLPRST
jgi:hypothetical protein